MTEISILPGHSFLFAFVCYCPGVLPLVQVAVADAFLAGLSEKQNPRFITIIISCRLEASCPVSTIPSLLELTSILSLEEKSPPNLHRLSLA
jgi:hypothetical protein